MSVGSWTCALTSYNLIYHTALHKPSEEELEFLRDLYTSDYERHKNRNPERAPGTCEWVFDHPEYLNWESKTTSSLLWVSADPGCGKSVLASFLIDKFKSTEFQEVLPSTVCFFFFKDDSDEQDNAISAISSILHQLFSAIPHLIKHALEWYQIKGKKLFHELRSLWNIFMSATSDASSKKVICVIDGLDERRNPSRDGLFQLLSDFCAKSTRQGEERTQLKIILLSRPYSFIEDALYHPLMIRMKMEDKSDLTGADVELVIRNRVNKFGRKRNIPDQVQKRLIDRLINYSGQTFLWVSLVLADLESSLRVSEMKLVELISQIPTNLNTMYEKILGKSPSPKDAQKILYIILGAIRPLSLAEMNIAFVIKPEDQGYEDLELEPTIERTIRNLCGLFVKVVDSKIYLVHQTAREFLLNINNSNVGDLNTWQNSLDLLEADNILAQICITYLMFKVFQEQPLESSQEHTGDRSKTRYLEKHSFLVYAATNWILHFRKIQNRATSVMIELVLHLFDMQSERGQTWFQILQASKDRHHDLRFSTGDALLCVASYCGCETIVDLLLQKGADLNSRNSVDATPLMLAISEGHDIVIKLLLEEGADFENQSFPTSTALQLATLKGNESMVKLLLERGANPNKRNVLNKTMLEAAASQEGDNTIPRALMAMGAESDPAVFNGSTALHFAARRGHKSMVRLLFEKGALLDVQNAKGDTALHLAASRGHESMVRLLFEKGALLDVQNARGNTALHFAAIRGRASVVIFLVEKGALLEVRNAEGNTALLSAARKGHKSVVEVLLEKGASLKDHNGEGDEALHSAASNWRETTVKYLLEKHTCVDVQNNEGQTAMHLAAKDGYESVIRLLLQCNANINVQDWKGRTPLHRAVMTWNNSETVRFLLANNASIDVQDEQGKTAVHLAIEHEELFTCQLLVENIAKIDVQDHDGNTALHLAVERGYIWAVRLLLENGADHNLLNRNGNTALHLAVEERHNWAFRLSFENGADRNLLNRDEYSPLDWAILKKRSSMIKLLNDYGAHSQISLMSDDMMEEKMLDY